MIVVAALFGTSAAISATLFGSGRLTEVLAQSKQLPKISGYQYAGQSVVGIGMIVILAILVSNFFNLHEIASLGSFGFLSVYAGVNLANVFLRKITGGYWIISLGALLACLVGLSGLMFHIYFHPDYHFEFEYLIFMISLALGISTYCRYKDKTSTAVPS